MRAMTLGVFAAAALVAACGETPDPWLTEAGAAADAAAGANTVIASRASYDAFECVADAPPLEIVSQGALGVATVGVTTETFEDPAAELAAEAPEGVIVEVSPCDGAEYQSSAIFYDAPADAAGIDTVVYREFGDGARPDRIHTVSVRVR